MTHDELREQVRREIAKYAKPNQRSTGLLRWCAANQVHASSTSQFLNGKAKPGRDLLGALGLEYQLMPIKRSPA